MSSGAEHLKERVSEHYSTKKAATRHVAAGGGLVGNWAEDRFDSKLLGTHGSRAALPTELDHTWRSSYQRMNEKVGETPLHQQRSQGQLSSTTKHLLSVLSTDGEAKNTLSQTQLVNIVDGRHRAFPGHQPECDLARAAPHTTEVRESYTSPDAHRARQELNAADVFTGPAWNKAEFVIFKVRQCLLYKKATEPAKAARSVSTKTGGTAGASTAHATSRTNYSFPGLRRALHQAEQHPTIDGLQKSDGFITVQELDAGLKAYQVTVTPEELIVLFANFDRDGSGEASVLDIVTGVRGQLNDRRKGVVAAAFRLLERAVARESQGVSAVAKTHSPSKKVKGVVVHFRDVIRFFDAAAHPEVTGGTHTPEHCASHIFEEYYSAGAAQRQKMADGVVTPEVFLDIYSDWSALVAADHDFERAVRDCWHLSGGVGSARNTSCRRVVVVHTNGRITNEEIVDDLGIDRSDLAATVENLEVQGIKDFKRIQADA
jgi:hypothetical protein